MAGSEAFSALIGNGELKKTLAGFTDRRAFPNTLLFTGPTGSGKMTAAKLSALAVACEASGPRPCLACEACRKIRDGLSPDVITVRPAGDRRTLGVETVRSIRDAALWKPNDLNVRVFLIPEAERLTVQAQNALLKILEEPPKNNYFFLMTSEPSALLPTVRSRAPELRTERFDPETLSDLLAKNSRAAAALRANDPDAFGRIVRTSDGSYGLALSRVERSDGKLDRAFEAVEALLAALTGSDKAAFLLLLLSEASDRELFAERLRLLETALRDLTAIKRDETPAALLFFPSREAASRFQALSLPALLRLYETVDGGLETLSDAGVNLRAAAAALAVRLWERKS